MASASSSSSLMMILLIISNTLMMGPTSGATTWCVARGEASDEALQTALDYACGSGADCAPVQSSGLCFLPNTVQAHASYAFNSYYQRRGNAPGSCSFGGVATVARTDPSYGSCVYPSSPSTAGGTLGSTVIPPPPPSGITTTPLYGGGGGLSPPESNACSEDLLLSLKTLLALSCLNLLVIYFLVSDHECCNKV